MLVLTVNNHPAIACWSLEVGRLERGVGCIPGWQWRHQNGAIGVVLVSLLSALSMISTLFWCFYCFLWRSKCGLGISNFDDIWFIHWFIYFVVIFRGKRLFYTVNTINFNNYLIYIIKFSVLLILWSILQTLLVLGMRYVETSHFICIVGWLTGFCIVRVFC